MISSLLRNNENLSKEFNESCLNFAKSYKEIQTINNISEEDKLYFSKIQDIGKNDRASIFIKK